jgi:hypothetical protein
LDKHACVLDDGVGIVEDLRCGVWVAGSVGHFSAVIDLGDDELKGIVGIPFLVKEGVVVVELLFGEAPIVGEEMVENVEDWDIVETGSYADSMEVGFFDCCSDFLFDGFVQGFNLVPLAQSFFMFTDGFSDLELRWRGIGICRLDAGVDSGGIWDSALIGIRGSADDKAQVAICSSSSERQDGSGIFLDFFTEGFEGEIVGMTNCFGETRDQETGDHALGSGGGDGDHAVSSCCGWKRQLQTVNRDP